MTLNSVPRASQSSDSVVVTEPMLLGPTPIDDPLPRRFSDFATLPEALSYAAQSQCGLNFYDARGALKVVAPYAELRQRALANGRRLLGMGLQAGDRVALVAETSLEFVSLFLGATEVGVLPVPLPLPTSFGGKEGYVQQIRNQLQSCEAAALVGPAGLLSMLVQASDGLACRWTGDWSDFAAIAESLSPIVPPSGRDIAYLQYSSGSTRFPHGVIITHEALMDNCRLQSEFGVQVRKGDRCISWLPFYHDMGLVGCLLAALCCQLSIDLLATDDFARRPLTWLKLISQNAGTTITYSPTFGYDLATRRVGPESLAQFDLSRWRVAGIGGDMIRPDVMEHFNKAYAPVGFNPSAFVPSYGLAECTLAVSFVPLGNGIQTELVDEEALRHIGMEIVPQESRTSIDKRAMVNCGIAMPGYEIDIRDLEGHSLADRHIGNLYVRGKSVMQGYFRDEESTAACMCADGWLNTGDMAYISNGSIFIVGRSKDMIIINGKNHWPQDIEWAVEQLPGLRSGDIAAFAITANNGEEVPAVLVQCRMSDPSEREAFKADVTSRVRNITGMNCLVELVPPRSLPRTSSGKLSRSKARTLYLAGELVPVDKAA